MPELKTTNLGFVSAYIFKPACLILNLMNDKTIDQPSLCASPVVNKKCDETYNEYVAKFILIVSEWGI
jgi:hypothetical protein